MPRVIEIELEADENDFTILVTRKDAAYAGNIDGVCTLEGYLEDGRLYNIAVTDAISAQTRELPMLGRPNPPAFHWHGLAKCNGQVNDPTCKVCSAV